MKKYVSTPLALAVSIAFLNGCSPADSSSNGQTTIPKFSIIKETPNYQLSKNNLEIRLEEKVDKASLTKLAYFLRAERSGKNMNAFGFFIISQKQPKGTTHGQYRILHLTV